MKAKVQLCSKHGNDLAPSSYMGCSYKACAHMVRPNVAEQLVVDKGKPETVPTASERLLRKRSDKVDPTLTFTQEVSPFFQ